MFLFSIEEEEHLKRILSLAGATIFILFMGLVGAPYLVIQIVRARLGGKSEGQKRQLFNQWEINIGLMLHWIIKYIWRVEVEYHFEQPIPKGPYLFVINHRSSWDHIFLAFIFRYLNVDDIRSVQKWEMRKAPLLGYANRAGGHVFVKRNGDSQDTIRVQASAVQANQDGASFLIYPEGTRWTLARAAKSRFKHLLGIRPKGFMILVDSLVSHRILSVNFDWGEGGAGRTMLDAGAMWRKKIRVRIWAWDDASMEDPIKELQIDWGLRDDMLSGLMPIELEMHETIRL